ncbi:MAG: hypothetical protein NWE80_02515 [Candidatus Bathyarchaeota archaeon]|nr:hypothetical protein [Candidatus Bathyarchaeota archaeon]
MRSSNSLSRPKIIKNKRAASPAISMLIITAVTVMLVVVSSIFAFQTLERQQSAAEFETVKKSILAFDDAVRDIAWDLGGSRSVRFTTNYGNVRLFSSNKSFEIITSGFSETINTAVVKYYLSSNFLALESGYSSYILGDERPVVSSLTDSFGQALVKQEPDFSTVSLNYRVRVSREGPSTVVHSTPINYVDILVIRLNCIDLSAAYGDFELVARNVGLNTTSYGPYPVESGTIKVVSEGIEKSIQLDLEAGQVIFNLIIADVQVST